MKKIHIYIYTFNDSAKFKTVTKILLKIYLYTNYIQSVIFNHFPDFQNDEWFQWFWNDDSAFWKNSLNYLQLTEQLSLQLQAVQEQQQFDHNQQFYI